MILMILPRMSQHKQRSDNFMHEPDQFDDLFERTSTYA